MVRTTMLVATLVAMLAGACLACRSEDVDLRVKVIVPAEIPTVASGELRMTLWAYDPRLADAPASPVDARVSSFTHQMGRQDEISMRVHGDVPAERQTYLTVRGFALFPDGEQYILWDGLESTGMPTTIVMKPVVTP